jgi:hypothetical protein
MNLIALPPKPVARAIIGAVWLSAAVFSAAAQPANGTDFTPFQLIGQRNIFDPNRVPRVRTTRSAPHVVDSFALVGTMSYPKGRFAFFDGSSPDFRKVLQLDGSIADFKVAAITPKTVTLLSGTNETILPLGIQMRRDDDGHWIVSADTASYASTGNSPPDRRSSDRRHANSSGSDGDNSPMTSAENTDNSGMAAQGGTNDPGTGLNAPGAANLPGGGANDALTRLMQQRAQQEQQLGQGSGQ